QVSRDAAAVHSMPQGIAPGHVATTATRTASHPEDAEGTAVSSHVAGGAKASPHGVPHRVRGRLRKTLLRWTGQGRIARERSPWGKRQRQYRCRDLVRLIKELRR